MKNDIKPHYDQLVSEYKSKDLIVHNSAIEKMTRFYSSDLLNYVLAKEGIDFAFDVARSICNYHDHFED